MQGRLWPALRSPRTPSLHSTFCHAEPISASVGKTSKKTKYFQAFPHSAITADGFRNKFGMTTFCHAEFISASVGKTSKKDDKLTLVYHYSCHAELVSASVGKTIKKVKNIIMIAFSVATFQFFSYLFIFFFFVAKQKIRKQNQKKKKLAPLRSLKSEGLKPPLRTSLLQP